MASSDAQDTNKEMLEMMRGLSSAMEDQKVRFRELQASQDKTSADLTAKLDSFAKEFKDELLKDVDSKMSNVAASVDELRKRMAGFELRDVHASLLVARRRRRGRPAAHTGA